MPNLLNRPFVWQGPCILDLATEEWRDVPGFEGRYEVSSLGRVYSAPKRRFREGRMLAGDANRAYTQFTLMSASNKKQKYLKHRLVAAAFLDFPLSDRTRVVDHIDRDYANCRLSNLRVVTHAENSNNRVVNPRTYVTHAMQDRAQEARASGVGVEDIAAELGLSVGVVYRLISGKYPPLMERN